jgi:hypothetical protein
MGSNGEAQHRIVDIQQGWKSLGVPRTTSHQDSQPSIASSER